MSESQSTFKNVSKLKVLILFLNSLSQAAISICTICLFFMVSKNPFEREYIGDLSKYYYGYPDIKNNDKVAQTTLEQNRKYEYQNFTSNKYKNKKRLLRHLVSDSFCDEIHEELEKYKGKKFESIFDFNFNKIKALSIPIFIISCILIGMQVIIIILVCCFFKETEPGCLKFLECFACIYVISYPILYIGRFILALIIFYYYEKSDLEKYDDFLECRSVKTNFFKKFSELDNFRNCFYAFLILNFIDQAIDKLDNLFEWYSEFGSENNDTKSNITVISN